MIDFLCGTEGEHGQQISWGCAGHSDQAYTHTQEAHACLLCHRLQHGQHSEATPADHQAKEGLHATQHWHQRRQANEGQHSRRSPQRGEPVPQIPQIAHIQRAAGWRACFGQSAGIFISQTALTGFETCVAPSTVVRCWVPTQNTRASRIQCEPKKETPINPH